LVFALSLTYWIVLDVYFTPLLLGLILCCTQIGCRDWDDGDGREAI
jgi:hypothetical protein